MATKRPAKQDEPHAVPTGPRIDADADPHNGMWLQRAPLFPFPFRKPTDMQPAPQPKHPARRSKQRPPR